jgi:hypothetical protein
VLISSIKLSTDAKKLVAWKGGKLHFESSQIFMPTRRQLLAAGRHDLVEKIMVKLDNSFSLRDSVIEGYEH